MRYPSKCSYIVAFMSCIVPLVAGASLPDLAPPKVQLVDEYGVNVHSGQVQSSLETVAIGGAMGLSHSISNYTNNFSIAGMRGYQDKFFARGRVTEIDTRFGRYKNVMRVHDFSGSADFELIVGGTAVNFGTGFVPNYTYRALGDRRHSLERREDGVYWTKPDGTVVKFEGGAAGYPSGVGLLREIQYPNGFTIYVDFSAKRVTTNTGFALKYIHQYDPADEFLDPAKLNIRYDNPIPRINAEAWASSNPKYVQAINTSVENCLASTCVQAWPQAEFDWPAGMPRTIYLGNSTFRVIDAVGGITEYYFKSFDLAWNEGSLHYEEYQNHSPRLIGIKPAGSTEKVYEYTYKNIFNSQAVDGFNWFFLSSEAGQILNAKRYGYLVSYSMGEAHNYDDVRNSGGGYIQGVLPRLEQYPGAISRVETREGVLDYEQNYRNFPVYYRKHSRMSETFKYDTRGNMNEHIRGAVSVTAYYPASCNAENFRYCNSPVWTRDGKGNQTDYVYHPSGQVAKVTYPPNDSNVRAETRYHYDPKPARYYQLVAGQWVKAPSSTPIWLKTEERYCINSHANASGIGCVGNDEVITRYEYEHDNLLLTGMTVTDPSGTTLRTCYQYDMYGNRIGETQPNANLASCNS